MITWHAIDAFPAIAEAAIAHPDIADGSWWPTDDEPSLVTAPDGHHAIHARAECDGLPIEVAFDGDRRIGLRLEFVDDVDDLLAAGSGGWEPMGRFAVEHEVVVGDVRDWARDIQRAGTRAVVELEPGDYVAEAFFDAGECVGIRILRTATS